MAPTLAKASLGKCTGALALLVLAGCGNHPSALQPTSLEKVGEVRPLGVPGWPLIDTLRVRSLGEEGELRRNQLVTWTVWSGGGSIRAIDRVTDGQGIARAIWTLGSGTGPNRVAVATSDAEVQWEVTGTAFTVDQLDAGRDMGCGLRSGDLWCWPWGNSPTTYSRDTVVGFDAIPASGPSLVEGGQSFTDLGVGSQSVCALTPAASVRCFPSSGSTSVPQLPPVRSIAGSGNIRFCALAVADSAAWCWNYGATPTRLPASPAFATLSIENGAGISTACGLLADSTARCWGSFPPGDGSNSASDPRLVGGGMKFTRITTGNGYACAQRPDAEVWCWGRNDNGELGRQPGMQELLPVFAAVGAGQVTAGRFTVGALYGTHPARWGGFQPRNSNMPRPLAGFAGRPVASFAKDENSCARLVDGQVYCYGEIWSTSTNFDIDRYVAVQPIPAQAGEP